MNGKTRPNQVPLQWGAGLRQYIIKDGSAGDVLLFNASQIQSAVGFLHEKIKEKVKDEEARKAALKAVEEAFPEFMPA
ncbi:MAG: hypothetical protein ABII71_02205 [Candidatus Micrarchaeota archaeon]